MSSQGKNAEPVERRAPDGMYRVVHFNGEGASRGYDDYEEKALAFQECDSKNRAATREGTGSDYIVFDSDGKYIRDRSAVAQSQGRIDVC